MLEQNGRVPIGYSSYVALYSRDDLIVIVLSNIQSEVVEQMGVGLAAISLGEGYENPRLRAGFNAPQLKVLMFITALRASTEPKKAAPLRDA